jgi:hypothetical protein
MASVSAVYDTLKDLANKTQNGFITPSVFNNFAQLAQVRIFNRLFDEIKDALRVNKAGFNPGRDKSRLKRIEEDLSHFARTEVISKQDGVFAKPEDVARIISSTTDGSLLLGESTRTIIEMCYDEDKIERILLSDISRPTENFPLALVSQDIEVFPESINRIRLRYYKYPQGITADGTATAALPNVVVDANDTPTASSIDFELPDHYINELVIEIGQLAGLSMRDQQLGQATQTEQNERKQESTF